MEEIVISGISGRFPGSSNVAELSEALFAGVDLAATPTRWEPGIFGLPKFVAPPLAEINWTKEVECTRMVPFDSSSPRFDWSGVP